MNLGSFSHPRADSPNNGRLYWGFIFHLFLRGWFIIGFTWVYHMIGGTWKIIYLQ